MGHSSFFVNLTRKEYVDGPYSNSNFDDLINLLEQFRAGEWTTDDEIVYIDEVFDANEEQLRDFSEDDLYEFRKVGIDYETGEVYIDEETTLGEEVTYQAPRRNRNRWFPLIW